MPYGQDLYVTLSFNDYLRMLVDSVDRIVHLLSDVTDVIWRRNTSAVIVLNLMDKARVIGHQRSKQVSTEVIYGKSSRRRGRTG